MQLFIVGGAVRDRLLGEPVNDRDWVAVGATPGELLALGFKPVGKDFPVFLHPQTGEEVALARTERKSGRGYHGFTFHAAPEVTLEQDLARRDLTINAMAEAADATLIDPFGGARDLAAGVLRHVSPAFAEDPVRLLRVARFAARWPHFRVAPETQALLTQLVQSGEVDALVPERVWQELSRGLLAARPSRMFEVLRECGALARLLPEPALDAGALARLDRAAAVAAPLAVRFALLGWEDAGGARGAGNAGNEGRAGRAGDASCTQGAGLASHADRAAVVTAAAERLRVPNDVRELAELWVRGGAAVRELAARPLGLLPRESSRAAGSPAEAAEAASGEAARVLACFERCDALRRPERFLHLLQVVGFFVPQADAALAPLQALLSAAHSADTAGAVRVATAAGSRGPALAEAVRAARAASIEARLRGL